MYIAAVIQLNKWGERIQIYLKKHLIMNIITYIGHLEDLVRNTCSVVFHLINSFEGYIINLHEIKGDITMSHNRQNVTFFPHYPPVPEQDYHWQSTNLIVELTFFEE